MSNFSYNYPSVWTTDGTINNVSITNGNTATSAAIDNNGYILTDISVTVTYGTTANQGINIYVLSDIDGTNYQNVNDGPWGFQMAYSTSTTYHAQFTVLANMVQKFQILLQNNTGATVAACYVRYKQATIQQS